MTKENSKVPQRVGWAPPFLSGLVLGAILVSCVYYFGVRNFDPDTEFIKTFPDVDKIFPNITFEFPERLQETDPDRVGAVRDPDLPQVENEASISTADNSEDEDETTELDTQETPDNNLSVSDEESITGYVLQAGAFTEKKHADSFRASLLIEGYNAFTTQISEADSIVQYRVIVGPYDTVEESRADSIRLKERNISTFVVPMREVTQ